MGVEDYQPQLYFVSPLQQLGYFRVVVATIPQNRVHYASPRPWAMNQPATYSSRSFQSLIPLFKGSSDVKGSSNTAIGQ